MRCKEVTCAYCIAQVIAVPWLISKHTLRDWVVVLVVVHSCEGSRGKLEGSSEFVVALSEGNCSSTCGDEAWFSAVGNKGTTLAYQTLPVWQILVEWFLWVVALGQFLSSPPAIYRPCVCFLHKKIFRLCTGVRRSFFFFMQLCAFWGCFGFWGRTGDVRVLSEYWLSTWWGWWMLTSEQP